jgi:hypothetical protein
VVVVYLDVEDAGVACKVLCVVLDCTLDHLKKMDKNLILSQYRFSEEIVK